MIHLFIYVNICHTLKLKNYQFNSLLAFLDFSSLDYSICFYFTTTFSTFTIFLPMSSKVPPLLVFISNYNPNLYCHLSILKIAYSVSLISSLAASIFFSLSLSAWF